MTVDRTDTYLIGLVNELRKLPRETEWVEFKRNNTSPDEIGEYISALANSAALCGKEAAYLVWGIEDENHGVVGTTFKPRKAKVGNEELENWIAHLLTPHIDFQIHEWLCDGLPVVLMQIQPALHSPVRFKDTEWIRVGSYKKKLKEHPEKERTLWAIFRNETFERQIATRAVSAEAVLTLLDYPGCFDLLGQALPDNRSGILERLIKERIILEKGDGRYDVTNLGAILFAKNLNQFDSLARKALRIVQYKGFDRLNALKEHVDLNGYAVGFARLVDYINDLLPSSEEIGRALRREVRMFPKIAIRELVANALIHQDFSLTGTGTMVEIFTDRIEISNPGTPLIDTLRFIDEPPQSRNEVLAATMRRLNICEERGSGIDKVISEIELFQLPAPDFQATRNHTRVILFSPKKKLSEMDPNERVRACYQHACLCWVTNKAMTNATLRGRMGIEEQNYAVASRIIAETIKAGLVKPADPTSKSKKHARYVPFWLM